MKKKIIILILLVPAVIIWHYVWFDSARRYVHAELAEQLIDLRIKERAVILKTINDLGRNDIEKANKRLDVLNEIYEEDLIILNQRIAIEGGVIESLLISRDSMDSLREFVKQFSVSGEVSHDSH